MNLTNASCRRRSSLSGFTLVELLVVIAIIGILAAAAFPFLIKAMTIAKESTAVQKAHDMNLALFNYATANGSYPAGATPEAAFQLLYDGNYVTIDGSYFLIPGTPGKQPAQTHLGKLSAFAAINNCWGYTTRGGGTGLTTSDPENLPVVASIGFSDTNLQSDAANLSPLNSFINPFGADGVAVGYKNMSSVFVKNNGPTQAGGVVGTAGPDHIALTPSGSLSFSTGVYQITAP